MTDNHDARALDDPEAKFSDKAAYADEIQKALESTNLPEFYANNFVVNLGTGDVMLIMNRNNKQVAMVQMSYTVAKSLSEALAGLIKKLEDRTDSKIMTSKFIASRMLEETNDESNDHTEY
jgi:hypothetical protein